MTVSYNGENMVKRLQRYFKINIVGILTGPRNFLQAKYILLILFD